MLSDAKEKLANRFLLVAAPDYFSTPQMPFTSAVGPATNEFFQTAIDALVMFPDCSSNSSCQKDSYTSQTEPDVLASVSLAPSIQALEQGRLYEAEITSCRLI